jgi:hypothetical protein
MRVGFSRLFEPGIMNDLVEVTRLGNTERIREETAKTKARQC